MEQEANIYRNRIFGESNSVLNVLSRNTDSNSFEEQYKTIVLLDFSRKSEMRVAYANNIFTLVCIYLCVVGVILWKSAVFLNGFQLSDNVLIALLTTTTANVLGLFAFVVKYLFPNDSK